MRKVMVLKEKAERSLILQEIWRWRYKFFICFFGAFFGVYIFFQTVNPYIYIAILNFLGYYIGIETMGYLRDRKSLDMYMSLPCNIKKVFLFKILLGTILSFIAVVLAFLICRYVSRDIIADESWQYVLSQKKIMGDYDYSSYFILNTLGFYLSFSCGIVGSAITFYISSGILFTIFTKCMFLPLMMYFATYFCTFLQGILPKKPTTVASGFLCSNYTTKRAPCQQLWRK